MKRFVWFGGFTFVALATLGAPPWAHAQEAQPNAYIAVGKAKTRKTVFAFPEIQSDANTREAARAIRETATADLTFMDLFKFMDGRAFIEKPDAGLQVGTFQNSDWTSIGAELVLKAKVTRTEASLTLDAYLTDVSGSKQLLGKRYLATPTEARSVAHTLANDVVTALTGSPGIFKTKIAMTCEKGGKKEIFFMDFDGTNVRQLTRHRSIAFAPAWNPDGTRLAYSLFNPRRDHTKNIDLFEFDFVTNRLRLLSNRTGMNSGAAYAPDGKGLALTMSFMGNPELFLLDPAAGTITRLTKSLGVDVDPTWSPDGSKLAFVSSRSGPAMVFTMNRDGSNPQRVTYAGQYNATPTWSARGNKLAFAGWLDGRFDLFIMNPDGSSIERLTKNQGNNEDPHFSPDGNFIVFSSDRTGSKNVYVMNADGSYVKRLTFGLGNCTTPKWSVPPPRSF